MQVFIDENDYGAAILEIGSYRNTDEQLRDAILAAADAAHQEVGQTADAVWQKVATAPQNSEIEKRNKTIEETEEKIRVLREKSAKLREKSLKKGQPSLMNDVAECDTKASNLTAWLNDYRKQSAGIGLGLTGSLRRLLRDAHTKAATKHQAEFDRIQREIEAFVTSKAEQLHRAGIAMKLHKEAAKEASGQEFKADRKRLLSDCVDVVRLAGPLA